MINNYNNKIANEVMINNLHLISQKIKELSDICIKEENNWKEIKVYCLYACISNKTKKIKFEILPISQKACSTYSTERFLVYSMYTNYRLNGHSDKNLDGIINNTINRFKTNCI